MLREVKFTLIEDLEVKLKSRQSYSGEVWSHRTSIQRQKCSISELYLLYGSHSVAIENWKCR